MSNKSIQKLNNNSELSTNFKFEDTKSFLEFCTTLSSSKLCPLDKAEDVAIALMTGQAMGANVMASINNVYSINGRATVGIHLIEAVLRNAGVVTEILENYSPLYPLYVYDYDDEGEKKLKDNKPIVLDVQYLFLNDIKERDMMYKEALLNADSYTPKILASLKPSYILKPAAYGTRIKLTRMLKQPDNSYKDMVVVSEFTTIDAAKIFVKGVSILEAKDAWKHHPKELLYANTLRKGGKIIADDILLGLYETSEMLNISDINYDVDNDGNYVILDKDGKKVSKPAEVNNTEESK